MTKAPRGTVQNSYFTQDGTQMYRVHWPKKDGPIAAPSKEDFTTGQAVTISPTGELVRCR